MKTQIKGKVSMKSYNLKIQMDSLIIILLSALLGTGCGKKSVTPTPSNPVTTNPTDDYKDPEAYGTPFNNIPDTKDIVMYEVNLRSFSASHSFKGVADRLDSIKALGVNTIWLMPTYPVGVLKSAGGLGSPYAVKDYNGVNAEFGTLADLRSLIAEAHNRNMAVIMDWVADHTSWDNAWINNKSWYKQDASGNIISPPGTGWNDVAALNYNNNDMRKAMIRAMKFWILTANADGYRCDASDFVPDDFWKQALDTLKDFKNRKLILLAEGSKQSMFSSGFQMNYAFDFYGTLKGVFAGTQAPDALFTTNNNENNQVSAGGFKLRYSTNHDVTSSDGATVTIYNGKQGALAAFVLAAYMNGVPLIYTGQEVGSPKQINIFNDDPIDWNANPDMTAAYKKIIAFRAAHEAIKTGALTTYNDTKVIAFEKKSGGDDVLILVNAKNEVADFSVPAAVQGNWTNGMTNSSISLTSKITLQPYQYLVLSK
ncbi:MAG TPA: alpha-amylase family glycosyl hydrolase [Mucilaginibacter sp.]|nr:alpha-amylase family glycosyl hydrolase [Mucilaginibacter sp.]